MSISSIRLARTDIRQEKDIKTNTVTDTDTRYGKADDGRRLFYSQLT